MSDRDFRGVALWRLGSEDPGLWKVLKREAWPSDDFKGAGLNDLESSQQAPRHDGEGEILRVTETPHGGARVVADPPDPDGDYSERYTQYPTPYVVQHSGATSDKLLCLTFDDGPDPSYTPRILDILKSRHVPATSSWSVSMPITSRPSSGGNTRKATRSGITPTRIRISLPFRLSSRTSNWTRLSESSRTCWGFRPRFFRPPYNADSEPETPEEIAPVYLAEKLGYATIAETVDPRDWEPGISADAIVNEVNNEIGNGHVILLHDAGGNRNAHRCRAAAHHRPVPETGLPVRAGFRPCWEEPRGRYAAPGFDELRLARIEGGAFDFEAKAFQTLGLLFLIAIYLTLARSLLFVVLAFLQKRREKRTHYDGAFRPPVSVLIAAYNEETVIARTIDSVLKIGYEDDGNHRRG